MVKVTVTLPCGCFGRSGYDEVQEFETYPEALERATDMVTDMNESFCGFHNFSLNEKSDGDIDIDGKMNGQATDSAMNQKMDGI